ncbi:MAG TPA: sugar transferase [Bacteroidales bacterium]|nr:sugar transferase [Bacteroidales bacterium]
MERSQKYLFLIRHPVFEYIAAILAGLSFKGTLIVKPLNVIFPNFIKKFQNSNEGIRTILIGSKHNASALYSEITSQKMLSGINIKGYVVVDETGQQLLNGSLPKLGKLDELPQIVANNGVEEAIIAIEPNEYHNLARIFSCLCKTDILVKVTSELRHTLHGELKNSPNFEGPLLQMWPKPMPFWQKAVKRLIDIKLSLAGLMLLWPVALVVAVIVKATSKGPAFFLQQRIGYHAKPFTIHKFRSMYLDAETDGPKLSFENDPRVTPFGRFMRKFRLDEIPQFYNVLIGNMSVVGPRPERQFYIEQIIKQAPNYYAILKIKPGITGMGQVYQGYTENVEQMTKRLHYDLLYLETRSLALDLKILFKTFKIIVLGRRGVK